ncbi:PAS domain-containing hybrid sensor histidine kinase/response regulator [Puia sp.]|uniref:PAS domain-containing hybrid sensor histidine kinase/response regulator n=1 Tax=Puia sp. TaxID=2045100 RepID=UPI002F41346B
MRIAFPARIALQRKIAWLLLFSFFSLCFIGWLIYFNKRNLEETADSMGHSYAVLDHMAKIRTRFSTWESLSRPPLSDAFHQDIQKSLDRIRVHSVAIPGMPASVDSLETAIRGLGTGADTLLLGRVRGLINGIAQRQQDEITERRSISRQTERKSTLLFISVSLLAFLFIVIILMRLNRDIVLRKRAERQLKENQAWLESILDNTTSLMYIKDTAGRYVMVNRRFEEILNVQGADAVGRTDEDISTPEEAAHYKFLDEQVMRTGKSLEIEEAVPVTGGTVNLLSIKFPLRDANGRLIGIGGIATDITERVQYQQQLIAATREAQAARGMQELFLANMSHEIRTPMNGIQGMTDLLLDTKLSDQQREFAKVIKRSVNNLLVVVNDVLDFSKIKAGKLAIEKIEFRLKDVLENAKAMFAHRIAKKGLDLQLVMDPAIPETLKGDPYRLNQVLVNLIGNAIKFTEQGWIRIEVTAQERTADQVNLLFTVADTGIGIPSASLPTLFDHFSQAGLDVSRRYGGTGLGLAICQQLLHLQGGEITVFSKENEGATFQFRLSYDYNSLSVAAPVAAVLADYSHCLEGKRFLVAEDNEVNQQLVDHVLRKGGGDVQLANNGEEAIGFLKKGGVYDLIIMDLQMPVMDGYAATRCIRQELHLPTPIIAMTATALVGEQLRCFESGMNDYMTKPFEFAELYKRITALLAPYAAAG